MRNKYQKKKKYLLPFLCQHVVRNDIYKIFHIWSEGSCDCECHHILFTSCFFFRPLETLICAVKNVILLKFYLIFSVIVHIHTLPSGYISYLLKKKVFHQKKTGGTNADACQVKESLNSLNSFLKHLAFHFTTFQLDLQKKMYKENKFVLSIFSFPSIFNLYVLSPHHSN